jgi:hypothetical protein
LNTVFNCFVVESDKTNLKRRINSLVNAPVFDAEVPVDVAEEPVDVVAVPVDAVAVPVDAAEVPVDAAVAVVFVDWPVAVFVD